MGSPGLANGGGAEIIPLSGRSVVRNGPGRCGQHLQDDRPVLRMEAAPEVQKGQFVGIFHELTLLFGIAAIKQKFGGNLVIFGKPREDIAPGKVMPIFNGAKISPAYPNRRRDVIGS